MNDYLVKGLAHIGIMTEDAKSCAQFYIDNLDFRPFYSYKLGELVLEFVECGGLVLEFVQSGKVEQDGVVNHVAIEVQGIEKLVEKLKNKGIVFETEEIAYMPAFFPNGVKNIFFRGPAGERIELFDYSR